MPEMDGYEVCQTLKADERYAKIPIIFLTALTEIENKTKGFQMGAVDYITKPFEITEVQARVKTHLSLVLASRELEMQNEILEIKVAERTHELAVTQDITIHSLASLAETRDNETGGHSFAPSAMCRRWPSTWLNIQSMGSSWIKRPWICSISPRHCTISARLVFPTLFCTSRASSPMKNSRP